MGLVLSRGRFVSRGRGRVIRLGFRVDSLSFVFHIGNISILIGLVGNNLHTAIRQVNTVFSGSVVVFTRFSMAESSTRVGILHSISVGINRGKEGFGSMVRSGGGMIGNRRRCGKSQESGRESNLKIQSRIQMILHLRFLTLFFNLFKFTKHNFTLRAMLFLRCTIVFN